MHKQVFPNPILESVERDVNEKILRVARFIITFYSRTELRKEIKSALRGNLLLKLEVLKKINFVKMTEFTDKKEKKELKKRLKHEIRPYPKNTQEFNKAIQNHTTIEPETDIKTKFW